MASKSDKELIEEYLKNNKIEIIPSVKPEDKHINVTPKKKSISDLMTLGEAIDTIGEKIRKTRKKKVNLPEINKKLIPSSLHGILDKYNSARDKEE